MTRSSRGGGVSERAVLPSFPISLATLGNEHWPDKRALAVAVATTAIGLGYTVGSEYVNTAVRQSWASSDQMPTLPWIGTGLAPFMQWIVVPAFALASTRSPVDA